MLIDFDTTHSVMLPYFDRLWDVVNGAWLDWNTEISPKVRSIASTRTRACMVNDFMRERGVRLAAEDRTITVVIRQQMQVLVFSPTGFDGCIGVRLKKLDEDGMSRNQPTGQVQDFRGQLVLTDINADYHLEAGYVLNRLESGLASIDLACPSGNGVFWKAEIVPNAVTEKVSNLFKQQLTDQIKTVRVRKKADKDTGDANEPIGTS